MDFFRTVFADDPDPPKSKPEVTGNSPQKEENQDSDDSSSPDAQTSTADANPYYGGGWSFGGLIKTISTKSESVLETYRRDLKEFGSGLKKEIEVAQGSLENVGHVIDEFGNSVLKGTAEIISHGKEAILAIDHESDSSDNNSNPNFSNQQSFNSKRYSRFDAQVLAIQGDVNTYCEEPEDVDDYNKWKLGFVLEEQGEEIENLLYDNGNMDSLYNRVVPNSVDQETFWFRYFYKVHKLKQAEDMRAKLVKRAISSEEEYLSWDVDDDDEADIVDKGKEGNVVNKGDVVGNREVDERDLTNALKEEESKVESSGGAKETEEKSVNVETISIDGGGRSEKTMKDNVVEEPHIGSNVTVDVVREENTSEVDNAGKGIVAESSSGNVSDEKVDSEKCSVVDKEDSVLKSDDKVASEGKAGPGDSNKDSDFSVVSSQPSSHEEEDLGWDEIEDLSSIDERKVAQGGSPNKAELRKRLSAVEDEEDLSWDIEDDDEPVKA